MRYGYIILGVIVLLVLVGVGIAAARNTNPVVGAGGCPLAQQAGYQPTAYQPAYQTASAMNTIRPATCPTAYQASALGSLGYYPQTYANPYISAANVQQTMGGYQPLMPMTWYTAPSQGQFYYAYGAPVTTKTTVVQPGTAGYQYNYQYQNQQVQQPGQSYYYQSGTPVQQSGTGWYQ